MFKGQIQANYFEMFNISYQFKSVRKVNGCYELVDYVDWTKEDRSRLKELITIYYPSARDRIDWNAIGEGRYAFSKSFLTKLVRNAEKKKELKNGIAECYRRKAKVKTSLVIWTTFKEFKDSLAIKGLKKRFVAVNARATNDYAEATTCIYLANRFIQPFLIHFFNQKDIVLNQELFALSELLQWLFRSAIRNDEPIFVYIPSERMRTLLEKYLNNEI